MYRYQSDGHFELWSSVPLRKAWKYLKWKKNILFNFI